LGAANVIQVDARKLAGHAVRFQEIVLAVADEEEGGHGG
jgi:hypothetical protein